jgi:CxxC-x17-CxxC domain-containing protein
MAFNDATLTCLDCQMPFTWSAAEQEFYASKGFTEPKRCSSCRASRKAARDSGTSYSGGSSSYDREPIAGGPQGYSRPAPREFFVAVCATCGGQAKVPFRPTSGKPVYCSDCFTPQAR